MNKHLTDLQSERLRVLSNALRGIRSSDLSLEDTSKKLTAAGKELLEIKRMVEAGYE